MANGQKTIVIADSSSTRTEWRLVEDGNIIEEASTMSLNPFFRTRREISHSIRLDLPASFFKRRWEHVYFYGAGCTNLEKKRIVEQSLVAQFKTPSTVYSDLEGAARGLLINEPGLACIIGTGSNSCLYDGTKIVQNVRPLGFILGDEGSGSVIGRLFVGDCMKGLAPKELAEEFFETYKLTHDMIMDSVYNNPHANHNLSSYSFFLADHQKEEYVHDLVAREFMRFFERNISQYDYKQYTVSIVGAVACVFTEILLEVARFFGAKIHKIVRDSMPGLVLYHQQEEE